MKKSLAWMLAAVMLIGMMSGCAKKEEKHELPKIPAEKIETAAPVQPLTPEKEETAQPESTLAPETPAAPEAPAEPEEPEEPELPDYAGYWLCVGADIDGAYMSAEEMASLLEIGKDEISALELEPDGTGLVFVFDEGIRVQWEATENGLAVDLAGECTEAVLDEEGRLALKESDSENLYYERTDERPALLDSDPLLLFAPDYSENLTTRMSTFMSAGRFLIDDGVIYGLVHQKNVGPAKFGSIAISGDTAVQLGELKVLDREAYPQYLCEMDGRLYFIRSVGDDGAVASMNKDGTDLKVLNEYGSSYLQIHDGRLFFTDGNYHLVSMNPDGSSVRMEIDKEVYYPYFIDDEWLIYQDDADNESLILCYYPTGREYKLVDGPAYCPIVDEGFLYYTVPNETASTVCRLNLDPDTFTRDIDDDGNMVYGFETERGDGIKDAVFAINAERIYGRNGAWEKKENWKKLSDEGYVSMTSAVEYIDDEYVIRFVYGRNGVNKTEVIRVHGDTDSTAVIPKYN